MESYGSCTAIVWFAYVYNVSQFEHLLKCILLNDDFVRGGAPKARSSTPCMHRPQQLGGPATSFQGNRWSTICRAATAGQRGTDMVLLSTAKGT